MNNPNCPWCKQPPKEGHCLVGLHIIGCACHCTDQHVRIAAARREWRRIVKAVSGR